VQLQAGVGGEIREVHLKAPSLQLLRVRWTHAATHLNMQVLGTEDFFLWSDAILSILHHYNEAFKQADQLVYTED